MVGGIPGWNIQEGRSSFNRNKMPNDQSKFNLIGETRWWAKEVFGKTNNEVDDSL